MLVCTHMCTHVYDVYQGFYPHYLMISVVKQTIAPTHPIRLIFPKHTINDTWTDTQLTMIEINAD